MNGNGNVNLVVVLFVIARFFLLSSKSKKKKRRKGWGSKWACHDRMRLVHSKENVTWYYFDHKFDEAINVEKHESYNQHTHQPACRCMKRARSCPVFSWFISIIFCSFVRSFLHSSAFKLQQVLCSKKCVCVCVGMNWKWVRVQVSEIKRYLDLLSFLSLLSLLFKCFFYA